MAKPDQRAPVFPTLPVTPPGFGVRQSSGALGLADSGAKAPEDRRGRLGKVFPLTPALSPSAGERENLRQSVGVSGASGMSEGWAYWLPTPEPRLVRGLPTIPPLPFRRGEGRGEGSDLGFRTSKRVKMPGDSLPEGEGRGEREHAALPPRLLDLISSATHPVTHS